MGRPALVVAEDAVWAAVVVAIGVGFYWFAVAPGRYRVRTVRVDGAVVLDEDEIVARSGITDEDSVFLVNSEAVAGRIAEMPRVEWCRATRVFPETVEIAVGERVAVATLLVNNRSFEVDGACHVLAELGVHEKPVGPFVTDTADNPTVAPGDQLAGRPVGGAVAVWEAFRRTAMARDVTVSEICARNDSRICMYCDEVDCEIRWGHGDLDQQAWKLNVFWRSQKGRIPYEHYVDLRFGDDVVCK